MHASGCSTFTFCLSLLKRRRATHAPQSVQPEYRGLSRAVREARGPRSTCLEQFMSDKKRRSVHAASGARVDSLMQPEMSRCCSAVHAESGTRSRTLTHLVGVTEGMSEVRDSFKIGAGTAERNSNKAQADSGIRSCMLRHQVMYVDAVKVDGWGWARWHVWMNKVI